MTLWLLTHNRHKLEKNRIESPDKKSLWFWWQLQDLFIISGEIIFFSETEKKLRELDNELNNLKNDIRSIAEKQTEVEEEKFGLDREVERQSAKVVDKETDYQILMKDFDIAKEREAVLMGDRLGNRVMTTASATSNFRATLDLNLRHISLEKKTTHDVHSRKVREKDRDLRNLKKADLQLKVAQDSVNHFQLIQEKVKGQVGCYITLARFISCITGGT